MESVTCHSKGRPLGHSEQLLMTQERHLEMALYVSVNVIESKNEIEAQQIANAFQQASKMNFLMRACVKSDTDNNNAPCFRPISDQQLEEEDWMRIDEISLDDEEGWEREIPKFMKEKFEYENGPLWRVVWAKIKNSKNKYILFFICSHAIIDGKSGFNLISNQIIPILNGEKSECNPIYFGKSQEEIFYGFNQQEMKISNRPMSFLLRTMGKLFSWKIYLSRLIWGEAQPCPIHHYYEKFVIEQRESQNFINICKSRGKSVHSVLMVLYYNAIEKTNVKFRIPATGSMVFYPADLRKFESVCSDPRTMPLGIYINTAQHEMRHSSISDEDDLFEAVSEVMATIPQFNCPKPRPNNSDIIFVLIEQGVLTASLADTFPPSFVLSNLGVCDSLNRFDKDSNRDVVLRNHFFTVESRIGFMVNLCTFRNKMHFAVSYGSKKTEPECANYFAEKFKENILKFVDLYYNC